MAARSRWSAHGDGARAAAPSFFPLDEALEVLPGSWSPSVHEVLVLLGAMLPFAQVREIGWRTMGVRISASSVRRMTERAGATLVAVEEAEVTDLRQTLPPTPRGAHRQQVSVDGAMVPVRGGHWREVKTMVIGELGEGTTIRHSYCAG